MPIAPFQANIFSGTAPAGVPDQDNNSFNPERLVGLPFALRPEATWLDYQCWPELILDPGMALHKQLPQVAATVDTLALAGINDPDLDTNLGANYGVNLSSSSKGADIIQRMATSTYRLILRGWAYRAVYPIPIPGNPRFMVNGRVVTSPQWVPDNPQRVIGPMLAGNLCGIPVFFSAWELHYITTGPLPRGTTIPVPANPALHIRPDAQIPQGIALPQTPVDQQAVPTKLQLTTKPVVQVPQAQLSR